MLVVRDWCLGYKDEEGGYSSNQAQPLPPFILYCETCTCWIPVPLTLTRYREMIKFEILAFIKRYE